MSETKKEMVNHPEHYKGNKFEVIEIIEDYNLGFNLGNAVKYILRCEKKYTKTQDLKKAIWYIEREIKNINEKREKDIVTASFAIKSGICQSCGMPYDIKDGELICEECRNKYVDENENEYKCVDNRNIK